MKKFFTYLLMNRASLAIIIFILAIFFVVYLIFSANNNRLYIECFEKPHWPSQLNSILPESEIEFIKGKYIFYYSYKDHIFLFLIKFKDLNGFDAFVRKVSELDKNFNNDNYQELAIESQESRDIVNKNDNYLDENSILYDDFLILTDYATKEHPAEYNVKIIRSSDKQYLYLEFSSWN